MIYDFLRAHQLNIMLFLSGICAIQILFIILSKTLSLQRKSALIMMNTGAFFLLISDRFCYIYRGDPSRTGYYMVRICNFLVFFLIVFIIYSYNYFIKDFFFSDYKNEKTLFRLRLSEIMFYISTVALIVSQFTNIYYYFDETNTYHRGQFMMVNYIFPLVMGLLQISIIIQYRKRVSRLIFVSLLLFSSLPYLSTILQIFAYGLSLTNLTSVGLVIFVYIISYIDINEKADKVGKMELAYYKEEQKKISLLFEQTAQSLVNAIDAKDIYTHGHSARVAEYAEKIAKASGMSDEECNDIYFAGLLHDVGKIGIPDEIINKDGKLTPEEYNIVKTHPVLGKQILSSIEESPYISIGANYHHERFDGTGYPEGLKGENIPMVARILAVADAYDAMTSKRSFRDPMPQQEVREELVKGMGTQFDPNFAKIMVHLIDLDTEFSMKEKDNIREFTKKDSIDVVDYRSEISESVLINETPITIKFKSRTFSAFSAPDCIPSIIIFDALDGSTHENDNKKEVMLYYEYGEVRVDGHITDEGCRKSLVNFEKKFDGELDYWLNANIRGVDFELNAVKVLDHLQIKMKSDFNTFTVTYALPDSSRFAYLAFTGRHCYIHDFEFERAKNPVGPGYIKRIARAISYIDSPAGDIPNIQINGWRSASSKGIPLYSTLTFTFHSQSLPTSRLVWHCPAISLFSSDDGMINGKNFKEYALIRMDGECWSEDGLSENNIVVQKSAEFEDWSNWKAIQRKGVECKFSVTKKTEKEIIIKSENYGITAVNTTNLALPVSNLYVAITGDQCALTNIRIY